MIPVLRVAGAGLACALAPSLASADAGASAAAKGPYVTSVSDTGATVRVELRSAAAVALEMTADGGDAGTRLVVASKAPSVMHVFRTTGLAPGTRYAYAIVSGGTAIARGHLLTAPPPGSAAAQTFLVYGDDRTDDDAHAAVVRAMAGTPSDFLVNTGDMVADGGSAANWSTFFDIERDLLRERPVFSAIGNHELYNDVAGASFARYFGFEGDDGAMYPYGTVRVGALRLFFLNGTNEFAGGPEREWLEHALAGADAEPGVVWRIAVVHHGPWSSGPHGPNARLASAHVPELLAAHHVDLVLSGHDHLYERGDAGILKYVVSGGGGAPLYRDIHPTAATRKVEAAHHFIAVTVQGAALQMVARRIDGSVLDRCGFVKGGPWDCDAAPAPSMDDASPRAPTPSPGAPAPSPARGGSCAVAAPGGAVPFAGVGALAALASLLFRRRRARRRPSPANHDCSRAAFTGTLG